jgi:hypothetical protein
MLDFLIWILTPPGFYWIRSKFEDAWSLDDDWRRWLVGLVVVVVLLLLFVGYAFLVAAIGGMFR